jgi:tripartite-type tricarboxylate transporter receptor subunit TctC
MNHHSPLRRTLLGLAGAVALTLAAGAHAQNYPTKPVKMIIPFAPGGSTDILARVIGRQLSEQLGQQVLVENRGGADGMIGMDNLAKAPADGYTLLFTTTSTHAINPSLYAGKLPYDPEKAFAEVSLTATAPNILVVNNKLPVNSVSELVALAKKKDGGLNAGSGATMHLLNTKLFESKVGGKYVTINYKGSGPALVDLSTGNVDMMVDQITTALAFVKDGRLKPLAVTSAKRFPGLPNVPTMMEAGVPEFETTSWWGILAPAGTPAAVIAKLNTEINKALTAPDVIEKIRSFGGEPTGGTPQQFTKLVHDERSRWSRIIKNYSISVN